MKKDFLRKIELFEGLSEEDLAEICEGIEEVQVRAGEVIVKEGTTGDRAYIIKQGELEILKDSGGRELMLAVRHPGEVIGEMALLERIPRTATVRARTDAQLYVISKELLDHLLNFSPTAMRAIFKTVLSRLRADEALLVQSQKMAQLGTLTAGVAHELNNPAAAVRRGASQLTEAIEQLTEIRAKLNTFPFSPEQREFIQSLEQRAKEHAISPPEMNAVIRSDKQALLEDWLDDRGFQDGWDLAPTMVNLGLSMNELDSISERFQSNETFTVISWLAATYDIYNLLTEINQGADRISEIVKALKSYAYLDQAPVQAVDVNEGLDNTLIIMRSKVKEGISVTREYDPNLPKIQGYGSELNQVWTNIIDNAIDALNGKGEITIRTRDGGNCIFVEIEDNGPGIPKEIQPRIFDPFFTTKPVGKGTGLGLDISYGIIVNRHRGELRVTSQPGRTCFQARIPKNFEKG
jgi:signal transduction histidine kinase